VLSKKNNQQLIALCLKGDRRAQRDLFEKHNKFLYSVSMRYMKNQHDAEEVLQDSWIQVFRDLNKYKDSGPFEGWIKTITIRTAWKAIRSKPKNIDLETIAHPTTTAMDQKIFDKMTCEEILQLLENIPIGSRVVFNMAVIDGLSHVEIGKILKIDASTSRAHLSKARKILKEKFNNNNKVFYERLRSI